MAASVSMAMPLTSAATAGNKLNQRRPESFLKPLPIMPSKKAMLVKPKSKGSLPVQASLKEKVATGLTAAALTASMVIPEVAEAAGSDVSPSLKNFLLSIFAGGVVLTVIFGAVVGVANFDPVKRT
ncbi:hypothetical protein CJ030_MR3G020215 [Morella rubra]|uniref:Ultraviolet-B-repressible protein n=1 Tax=Morella rubra TaxID=262757 RepID=A0A6A1W8F1_9ROSI|nr:hypothetical protein CJ030_MR3G020215 [Morella rubra]